VALYVDVVAVLVAALPVQVAVHLHQAEAGAERAQRAQPVRAIRMERPGGPEVLSAQMAIMEPLWAADVLAAALEQEVVPVPVAMHSAAMVQAVLSVVVLSQE
jgi:hypothetical protein